MNNNEILIRDSVMRDMSEGVMTIGFDGVISYLNPAAERILGHNAQDILNKTFADLFLKDEENDSFVQAILDAVYDQGRSHNEVVAFYTGGNVRQLHMVTSFLRDGTAPVGVIVVLNDITELAEMKIEYARKVTGLLDSVLSALSAAIEERSRYNANHTRNMACYAEHFLDYLAASGSNWKFDENRRRAFLMSVWLHDVGKIAVPLEVMDKATRLGPALDDIRKRFEKMSLLDRIALLEGRLDETAFAQNERERETALAFVEQINRAGRLSDRELSMVRELAGKHYLDANGNPRPWFKESELSALSVREGTLTDREREIMQSHVLVTQRILGKVSFPDIYADVPAWASAHHEKLNGKGYPRHLTGEHIPREVRLLTILDIFEALTAADRPYKTALTQEKAFGILHDMARDGSVDGEVLALFEASRAWKGR